MKSKNGDVLFALADVVKGVAKFSFPGLISSRYASDDRDDGPVVETRRRTRVLQELYRKYASEFPSDDGATLYRNGLPPDHWVNDQLHNRKEPWRVHNVDGFRCEVIDTRG